jgi:dihydropteroate synthase
MNIKNSEIKTIAYASHGKIITFDKPLVMAIVNLTPDSFYDGGKFSTVKDILNDAEEKISQGADIIDLGAASSRPGAKEISLEEEWDRLKDALQALRKQFPTIFISVDTYRAEIALKSADLGVDMINDISGGNLDDEMFKVISKLDIPYILMHMQGNPKTMQENPFYQDVTAEVKNEFAKKIKIFEALGFNKLILDPGFGFGKTLAHNYTLLKNLNIFKELKLPLLAGMSRKRMINQVIGTSPVTALNGTTVLHTIALLNGASILRVHDVREAVQAIQLVEYYNAF